MQGQLTMKQRGTLDNKLANREDLFVLFRLVLVEE